MTQVEPTLAAPMPPSTIDLASIFAVHAERQARIDALRPGNKDRLFDGLSAAGITHVKAIRPEPWMGRTEKIEALVEPHLAPPVLEVR